MTMYIISATIKKSDNKVFLIKVDNSYVWTLDVSKIKIFNKVSEAAIFLSDALNHKDDFENFNLIDTVTIQIFRLDMKQM